MFRIMCIAKQSSTTQAVVNNHASGAKRHHCARLNTCLYSQSLEQQNLSEEQNAGNNQRRAQGVESRSPWTGPVIPSDGHADENAQYAQGIKNTPVVLELHTDVPLHLAALPEYPSLTKNTLGEKQTIKQFCYKLSDHKIIGRSATDIKPRHNICQCAKPFIHNHKQRDKQRPHNKTNMY